MKVRNGFVSNSSSSSFICDYCHTVEVDEGGDMGMYEFGFVECKAGHTICISHLSTKSQRKIYELAADDEDFQYSPIIQTDDCPLCQLEVIRDDDLVNFLLQTVGKTRKELISEIKERAATLDNFRSYIKKKEPLPPIPSPPPAGHRVLDL
jgi:hypothetical protein